MNLGRMRRWSRVVAVILLIAAGRGLPHFAQDDPGCSPAVIQSYAAHQQSDHAVGEASRADHRNHCAVCHWSRSLRSPLTAVSVWLADVNPPTLVSRGPVLAAAAVVEPALPARAPPSLLV